MKTFEELRKVYIEQSSSVGVEESLLTEKKNIPKKKFLQMLEDAGAKITSRTLSYYIGEKLIEKPRIGAKDVGRGKESFFSDENFRAILNLKALQKDGLTIKEIKRKWDANKDFSQILKVEIEGYENIEEDFFLKRFKDLSNIFIENLPGEISENSLREYTTFTEPNRLKTCVKIAQQIKPLEDVGYEIANELFRYESTVFYKSLISESWDNRLDAYYFDTISIAEKEKPILSGLYIPSALSRLIAERVILLIFLFECFSKPLEKMKKDKNLNEIISKAKEIKGSLRGAIAGLNSL